MYSQQRYGPGKSYYTWLEYFPNVDLYYIVSYPFPYQPSNPPPFHKT